MKKANEIVVGDVIVWPLSKCCGEPGPDSIDVHVSSILKEDDVLIGFVDKNRITWWTHRDAQFWVNQ